MSDEAASTNHSKVEKLDLRWNSQTVGAGHCGLRKTLLRNGTHILYRDNGVGGVKESSIL